VLTFRGMSIETVIFDLDGVLLESEEAWNAVRRDFAVAHGGRWGEHDQPLLMGANSMEWAAHMRVHNSLPLSDQEIYDGIITGLRVRYAQHLPLVPGAAEAVRRLAAVYRLAVASSSPREIIEFVLQLAGLRPCFAAVVSSDEVRKGKPAPDVYVEACAQLGVAPGSAAAVEDSSNGIAAAHASGAVVIAIPNPSYPPSAESLALADVVLGSIEELDRAFVESLDPGRGE
jgi:HAD superfamily hydrolase (TIGR01509 family)